MVLVNNCNADDPKAAYRQAGVDVDAGQQAVSIAKQQAQRTVTGLLPVLSGVGGFSSGFTLPAGYQQPVLLAGCDGVGTKLLLAHQLNDFSTVGVDLVAMNANDVLANGGQPIAFMDYLATGALKAEQFEQLLTGVANGCVEAGCQLIGGETAEMPGLYAPGHVDLAGFCLGISEKTSLYPRLEYVQPGDAIIGLASSGCHSNGYSLIRKILSDNHIDLGQQLADKQTSGITIGQALLAPTKIYVDAVHQVISAFPDGVKSMAHITGGGFEENLPRSLPEHCGAALNVWPLSPLYQWLAEAGDLDWLTLTHTFNAGIGFTLTVDVNQAEAVIDKFNAISPELSAKVIGVVTEYVADSRAPKVIWEK